MRIPEIEAWALRVVRNVQAGQRNEDARVELKATWPEAARSARRVAAHANAAHGESILWLIGIDEDAANIPGADRTEIAKWWSQLCAEFDGEAPRLKSVIVHVSDVTVVALYMECLQLPYVVRNQSFGSAGVSVSHEVPWREGTSTRSARHTDLVQLLVPLVRRPVVAALAGSLKCTLSMEGREPGAARVTRFSAVLYLTPSQPGRVVVPFHACHGEIRFVGADEIVPLKQISLHPDQPPFLPYIRGIGEPHPPPPEPLSRTIDSTGDELIIDGPGKANLSAECTVPADVTLSERCNVMFTLGIAAIDAPPIELALELLHSEPESEAEKYKVWRFIGVD